MIPAVTPATEWPTKAATTALAPVVILVVDDNATKRLAVKAVLAPLGYRVVEADSGIDALRCVLAENFAVILLDVRMPIMDGFETAALIRQRRESEMTPIIFITSHGSDEISQNDRWADGAVDFIFAPINPGELRAKVVVFANLFLRAESLAARARELQATTDQLRLLTDAAPIGIFQTDAEHRYVYTNSYWSQITGVAHDTAAGQSWDLIVDAPQRDELRELWEQAAAAGEPTFRVEIRLPGVAARIGQLITRSIPDRDGGIAGWVGTLADVTAEVGAEVAMSDAHDAAVAASALQKSFAASASHELRTPTTSILGYTEEMLDGDALTPRDRRYLDIVHRNAQRLARLIDDLLIVGEAEIGASRMHVEPTVLAPLVEGVVSNFFAAAQRADVSVVTDFGPDPPAVLADPLRFEQVLTNLMSNAIKFTPKGGEVSVAVRQANDAVEISVTDTGIGMNKSEVERIFDRFYRAKGAVDSAVPGSGLGLAIAKRMIEAQNGQVRVVSELGQGSTFTMTLPAANRELSPA